MTQSVQILVVDDDPDIRAVVSMTLEEEGYSVYTASDGAEALVLLEQKLPALILLDMRMPVMDGWNFMQAYRQSSLPAVPVIVLTAARDAAIYAHEVSATSYLAKPFRLEELLRVVAQYIT